MLIMYLILNLPCFVLRARPAGEFEFEYLIAPRNEKAPLTELLLGANFGELTGPWWRAMSELILIDVHSYIYPALPIRVLVTSHRYSGFGPSAAASAAIGSIAC